MHYLIEAKYESAFKAKANPNKQHRNQSLVKEISEDEIRKMARLPILDSILTIIIVAIPFLYFDFLVIKLKVKNKGIKVTLIVICTIIILYGSYYIICDRVSHVGARDGRDFSLAWDK